jgi:hypothetical protein
LAAPLVVGNSISDHEIGIRVGTGATQIKNNVISANVLGVLFEACVMPGFTADNNEVADNETNVRIEDCEAGSSLARDHEMAAGRPTPLTNNRIHETGGQFVNPCTSYPRKEHRHRNLEDSLSITV